LFERLSVSNYQLDCLNDKVYQNEDNRFYIVFNRSSHSYIELLFTHSSRCALTAWVNTHVVQSFVLLSAILINLQVSLITRTKLELQQTDKVNWKESIFHP